MNRAIGVSTSGLRATTTKKMPIRGGNGIKQLALALWREEAGQDLTEYALLMVLIALAAVASMQTLANTINNVFSNAASNLNSQT